MPKNQKLRMFAGPNGGGKTTLAETIHKKYADIGYFINADKVAQLFSKWTFLDLNQFSPVIITQEELEDFARNFPEIEKRLNKPFASFSVFIKDGFAIKKDKKLGITDYEAVFLTDFLRNRLLKAKCNFSFETVMSHPSKIDFLQEANEYGFKTYLYFLATVAPEIHIERVHERMKKGGHGVPDNKIKERYFRSLNNLIKAIKTVDRAFIIDNSNQSDNLIAEKTGDNKLRFHVTSVPSWVYKYVIEKI